MASAERITLNSEIRAMKTTDGSMKIAGYAAMFNKESTGLTFREVIAPGAFTRTLAQGDPVYLLVNHDTESLPLASTASGTLTVREDEQGLYMEATLDPANPRAVELNSVLDRGDVDKMSFAFTVADGGETRDGEIRTLTDLNLYEVSVVTWPAYDSTSVAKRSAEEEKSDLDFRTRLAKAKLNNLRLRK
jgi:HK97 family phage prohead protease